MDRETALAQVMRADDAEGDAPPSDFDWGTLGEPWWRQAGASCKPQASEKQMRFACAKRMGATNTGAARLAGYADDGGDQVRQAAHRAINSTAVQQMLALADVEDKSSEPKVLDRASRALRLSELAVSHDPTVKIRAIELLNKMDAEPVSGGGPFGADRDGLLDCRMARDYLSFPGGAAAFVHLWTGQGSGVDCLPLLHDVHRKVLQEAPEVWERAAKRLPVSGRARLERFLADPEYQHEIREKIWREIGQPIDPLPAQNARRVLEPQGAE